MGAVRLGLRLGSGYRISELVLAFPLGWGLWVWDGGCGAGMGAVGLGCWVGIEVRMWEIG